MSKEYWKEVLNTAGKKLEELRSKRDALDAEREEVNLEVIQLEELVSNLIPLTTETPLNDINPLKIENVTDLNLADACRVVLKMSNTFLTPIRIRDILAASKYDLSQFSNPLASIHGVLKRMAESGEVELLTHETRGTMYYWRASIQPGNPRGPRPISYGGGPVPDGIVEPFSGKGRIPQRRLGEPKLTEKTFGEKKTRRLGEKKD